MYHEKYPGVIDGVEKLLDSSLMSSLIWVGVLIGAQYPGGAVQCSAALSIVELAGGCHLPHNK